MPAGVLAFVIALFSSLMLTVPVIHIPAPDLSVYDALRAGAAA